MRFSAVPMIYFKAMVLERTMKLKNGFQSSPRLESTAPRSTTVPLLPSNRRI